jgi:hypothetical protein
MEVTRALRAMGFDLAMVDLAEIERLHASGYSDERLSPGAVGRWMRGGTVLIRAWPERGVFLVDLRVRGGGGAVGQQGGGGGER